MAIKTGKYQLESPAAETPNLFKRLSLLNNRKLVSLLLGFGVVLIIGLLAWNFRPWENPLSMRDVVYGEKVLAVHGMNLDPAGAKKWAAKGADGSQAKIEVSEAFHDFGEISPDALISRAFIISNQGQAPLVIQNASTTCGCTTAEISASLIPPGKAALMQLKFDPRYHDMHGTTVRRGVVFETNDPEHPLQEIWIQATVK